MKCYIFETYIRIESSRVESRPTYACRYTYKGETHHESLMLHAACIDGLLLVHPPRLQKELKPTLTDCMPAAEANLTCTENRLRRPLRGGAGRASTRRCCYELDVPFWAQAPKKLRKVNSTQTLTRVGNGDRRATGGDRSPLLPRFFHFLNSSLGKKRTRLVEETKTAAEETKRAAPWRCHQK